MEGILLKPFQIIWELIEFGLQALFLWVLAIILCVGLIAGVIYNKKQQEPQVEYIYEKVEIVKEIEKTIEEKKCARVAGCRVLEDGTVEW